MTCNNPKSTARRYAMMRPRTGRDNIVVFCACVVLCCDAVGCLLACWFVSSLSFMLPFVCLCGLLPVVLFVMVVSFVPLKRDRVREKGNRTIREADTRKIPLFCVSTSRDCLVDPTLIRANLSPDLLAREFVARGNDNCTTSRTVRKTPIRSFLVNVERVCVLWPFSSRRGV